MKLNRRNTIIGLGTIVAGGGAALGSGAFSTVTAERGLEVNVVTGENISEEFVDIVIKPPLDGTDLTSVGFRDEDGDRDDDVDAFFPDDPDSQYEQTVSFDSSAISLVDNDVTIVFGATDDGDFDDLDGIPANSRVEYDDLFEIINDDGDDPTGFDVTFELINSPNYELEFEDPDMSSAQPVDSGTSTNVETTTLTTGGEQDTTGELRITIE